MKTPCLSFFFVFFCLWAVISAQKNDSLSQKSNRYLVAKLDSFEFRRSDTLVWVYLNAYIQNAKQKKDYETLFYGYREGIYYSPNQYQKLKYADSAISAAEITNSPDLKGSSYLSKGTTYYHLKSYKDALDNFIKANNYLNNTNDKFLKNKTLLSIAIIKNYLGYYNDALELLQQIKEGNSSSSRSLYIRSLFEVADIYQKTGQYEKASETNLLGLQEAKKYGEKSQEQYFNMAIGIDDYFERNYAIAIHNIHKALPIIRDNKDFNSEAKGYSYIAQCYLELGQEEKALLHFQKVDSLFVKNKYLSNELRESYEWLINYYKKEHNKDKQLYYINQLLKVDEANAVNNRYLAHKISKEYDTKRLLEEKQRLERRFSNWLYYGLAVALILLTICIFLFLKNRKAKHRNEELKKHNKELEKRFNELIHQKAPQTTVEQKETIVKKASKEIPAEVAKDILKRLDSFEEKKEFLNPKIDQRILAEKFKTNTTYLSKIINTSKGTNFNGYLNELRIDHIVDLLKNQPKYRHYTIETLSEMSGYANPRQFSDAFYAKTELRPVYFLEQIQKEEPVPI